MHLNAAVSFSVQRMTVTPKCFLFLGLLGQLEINFAVTKGLFASTAGTLSRQLNLRLFTFCMRLVFGKKTFSKVPSLVLIVATTKYNVNIV